MKAAVLYDINTPLQIESFNLPDIEDDQVRVRLIASGVCHSIGPNHGCGNHRTADHQTL